MRRSPTLTLLPTCLLALSLASGLAGEFAEKGREVLARNEHAVLTLQVVMKISGPGGRSSESRQEITGTVVDPSGLIVVALSACDPAEMYRRISDDYKIDVEVSDIKILLDDGSEVPGEIVLRDKDFDLAFVRPKVKPATRMAAVDLTRSGTAQVLDDVITLTRLNKAASRAYAASVEHIAAVIQKPRTFYVPDSSMSTTALGSPAFLPDGRILGIFVMRAINAAGSDSPNYRQNMTSIILPAGDVLQAAKQAPEPKSPSEQKSTPSEGAKAGK
jgi:hypothetical protein